MAQAGLQLDDSCSAVPVSWLHPGSLPAAGQTDAHVTAGKGPWPPPVSQAHGMMGGTVLSFRWGHGHGSHPSCVDVFPCSPLSQEACLPGPAVLCSSGGQVQPLLRLITGLSLPLWPWGLGTWAVSGDLRV